MGCRRVIAGLGVRPWRCCARLMLEGRAQVFGVGSDRGRADVGGMGTPRLYIRILGACRTGGDELMRV